MDSIDSLYIIEITSVLYPPPMSTYKWVLRDLYIGGGVQDTMKYGMLEDQENQNVQQPSTIIKLPSYHLI